MESLNLMHGIIDRYIAFLEEKGEYGETFKWDGITNFQNVWNIEASDFNTMFKNAFRIRGKLFFQNSWGFISNLAKHFPEDIRLMFRNLYNENIDLEKRILDFQESAKEMLPKVKVALDKISLNHQQDERTISVYLSFRYPEKYFIYMDSFYRNYCTALKIPPAAPNKKYLHYLELANNLRDNYVRGNAALSELHDSIFPNTSWNSENVATQNILFSLFMNAESTDPAINPNYWIFQGNPKYFRIFDALKDNALKTWVVSAHKNEIIIGDKIILWITGENSGCYALCKVVSQVENRIDDEIEQKYYTDLAKPELSDKVEIEIEYNLWNQPVLKQVLLDLPEFEKFNAGNRGTNFNSTELQYEKILRIYWENSLLNAFTKVGTREYLEHFLDLLLSVTNNFKLKNDDPRISFSTPKISQKYISATIGQRYILSLENTNTEYPNKYEFAFIAAEEKKEIFKSKNGFKRFGEYKTTLISKLAPSYAYYNESVLPITNDLVEAWFYSVNDELERAERSSYRPNHNSLFFRAVIDNEYRNNLLDKIFKSSPSMKSNNLNQILFGPPGTGKTFQTINEALKIVDPDFYEINKGNRGLLKKRFRELTITDWEKTNGQIVFCTFHQSFSYEDFVEGIKPLKPKDDDQFIKYDIVPGVFKNICTLSRDNEKSKKIQSNPLVSMSEFEFNKAIFYKLSLGDIQDPNDNEIYDYCMKNNCISIGFGGGVDFSGLNESEINHKCRELNLEVFHGQALNFFIHYMKIGNYVVISKGNRYVRALGKIKGPYQYKADSSIRYNNFREVEWIFKDENIPINEIYDRNLSQMTIYKLDEKGIQHDFFVKTPKPILEFEKKEENKDEKKFVLIIDEINRGNISSIFGELITLIEKDKRAGAKEELEVMLPYSKEPFKVPDNVYLIGTMNTADRSIEALDTALRRRFSFKEIAPIPELIKQEGSLAPDGKIDDIDVVKMLEVINFRIEKLIDKDHKIGHAYFLHIKKGKQALEDLFADKIIPLLEEYFFGDFGKIGLVLGESFVEKVSMNGFDFAPFTVYGEMISDLKEKSVYRIKSQDKWDFASIYQTKEG